MVHFALWMLGLAEAETQTTVAERECLTRHAAGKRRLVEIGCWHGFTTRRLRAAMAADGVLLAVDPYPAGRLGFSAPRIIARSGVARVSNGRVDWVRCTGAEAARAYATGGGEPVDFVFIDADHSYEGLRGDWDGWSTLVSRGGVVALHDSRPRVHPPLDDSGSVAFTRNVVLRDQRYRVVETVDTLTVLRRIG